MPVTDNDGASVSPLITFAAAAAMPDVIFADVRWYLDGRSGRAAYEAGHLPTARFVDLDRDLTQPGDPTAGRHPLPSPEYFAERLGALGIGDDAPVVAYDDAGGTSAARLVWMLRAIGQPAALLDGGIGAFSGALELGGGTPATAVQRAVRAFPVERLASAHDIEGFGEGTAGDAVLLDARAPQRFRGEFEPVDPRAGHIPGARNLPLGSLLDPSGRFLPPEELGRRFVAVGATPGAPVIFSCGSGVSACAVLLASEAAGLDGGRLFVASFSGWSSDPTRAVETTSASD
jgi:thiosulfate/3-mercaptopyruvate sulfurtransferase